MQGDRNYSDSDSKDDVGRGRNRSMRFRRGFDVTDLRELAARATIHLQDAGRHQNYLPTYQLSTY
jgi:hypothetical protein